jgi:hypothetical protein
LNLAIRKQATTPEISGDDQEAWLLNLAIRKQATTPEISRDDEEVWLFMIRKQAATHEISGDDQEVWLSEAILWTHEHFFFGNVFEIKMAK